MALADNNKTLEVKALKTWIDTEGGIIHAVDGVSFNIRPGETLAILGESGCGKSLTALSILQLIPKPAGRIVSGKVMFSGENLLEKSEQDMREIRGRRIAMIFQEPQSSLNPVMTIGQQIKEVLPDRRNKSAIEINKDIVGLLDSVGMSDSARRIKEYPHQLSGGMKQRAMIAMALASKPDILIADEPTTALDVTIQSQILNLLARLKKENNMSILLITHDLGVVSQMADRVLLMYAGEAVEDADAVNFFVAARHPYAQKLFQSIPDRSKRKKKLDIIPGMVPTYAGDYQGCRFAERCDKAWDLCFQEKPQWRSQDENGVRCHLYNDTLELQDTLNKKIEQEFVTTDEKVTREEILLDVKQLKVHFPIHKGIFRRVVGHVKAVDGISLKVGRGRTVAIVGESGCGKTTAGKAILQLIKPTSGEVIYDGASLTKMAGNELRQLRKNFQIIFQDPYASLNPRMLVGESIAEGLHALKLESSKETIQKRVKKILTQVGMPEEAYARYPHEFSGGQRQRISIARALAVNPELIVCDEPTSALDVSVQAQILNLLNDLQRELSLSYLFITHDISVVEYLAHEVAVMYLGRIVEFGTAADILDNALHPYTQALLSAVPVISRIGNAGNAGHKDGTQFLLAGDIPSPSNPPAGCHFHVRCPQATEICRQQYPGQTRVTGSHTVFCHLFESAPELTGQN